MRAAPDGSAEQVTQALLHEPLRVADRVQGWARVVTAYDYSGWIREELIEEGAGLLPSAGSGTPLDAARAFVSAAYEWGGLSARGIDCSGLVHVAYRLTGRLVPRDAWQQEEAGSPVVGKPLPGDLVSYGAGARADHIAFLAGPTRILHATARDGLGVVIEDEPDTLFRSRRHVFRL